jgi:site-specific DNA recombinase
MSKKELENLVSTNFTKRVFIYVRVSTNKQAEEGYSIPQQIDRLSKYCEAMGWTVVKVYTDDGYSGGDLERPAMKQMIKELDKGNADIVLVDKLDRLSRSQFDTLYMIQKVFDPNNVGFVSRAESFDTSTPFGKAMVGILAVFAELERSRIKERMADGKEGRAKEGKYKGGGKPSIGYDYNPETGGLKINEYESMMIQELFDLVLERMPMNAIANLFNKKGYKTKYGAWNDTTVRYATMNKVYIGKIKHKGIWYEGLHDGIIPEEKFEKVAQIMEERKLTYERYKPGKRYNSPLGGLIWCKHCNTKYSWRVSGKNKDGTRRAYYTCYSRAKCDPKLVVDPNCKNKNYRDTVLDEIIYNEIRKLKTDAAYFDELRDSMDNTNKIELIKKRIDDVDAQISKLMDLYALGTIDLNVIKNKIEPLNQEKSSLEDELENLEIEIPSIAKEHVLALVDTFEEVLAEGNSMYIHDAVAELIDYIEIDGEDIRITWNF